jgi:hypothetical protein
MQSNMVGSDVNIVNLICYLLIYRKHINKILYLFIYSNFAHGIFTKKKCTFFKFVYLVTILNIDKLN